VLVQDLGAQLFEALHATGAQRQIAALCGEGAGHTGSRPELAPWMRIFWRVMAAG
jgi:hypothetical protein